MATTVENSKQTIPCRTKDGEMFQVELEAIRQSKTFENMYQDLNLAEDPSFVFEMQVVTSEVFQKIYDWLRNHVGVPEPVITVDNDTKARIWFVLNQYENNFLKLSVDELMELLTAASYLDIPSLQLYSAQAVASQVREVIDYPQKVRDLLNLPDDLTKEEKEQIKKDNPWCDYDKMKE